jgi:dipeptidyl aminopeptidase/acylaminoacyl peptidase
MSAKRRLRVTPQALLEIRTPFELCLSPDGSRAVYAVEEVNWDDNKMDQHLTVICTDGEGEPRQITRGEGSESLPQFSPDGLRLAFLRTEADAEDAIDEDAAEDARTQVWVLPMDGLGGEAEKLTDAPRGVSAFDWLPDSSGIVYLAREPRAKPLQSAYEDRLDLEDDASVERAEIFRQQIWRIDLKNRKAKLVHAGDPGVGEVSVSPDGKSVAFSTNYTGEENDYHLSDIWTIPLAGGPARKLTDGPGGKYHPRWRPDGERVFFIRALDPSISFSQPNLYSVPAMGGETVLESEDMPGDITGWRAFAWDAGGTLYVSVADGTATVVVRRKPDGAFTPFIDDDGHVHEFAVARDGAVAFVGSDGISPPELFRRAAGAREAEALTDLNADWTDTYLLGAVETVSWTSPDGLTIEGLLTLPYGYDPGRKYPLVVTVHGGPYARAALATTGGSLNQVLAADGFVVLSPNYRGSEGYGNDFSLAIKGDLGGGDYEDVIAGVDWAIAEGIADPERLAIMGSSYGGYLANLAIARTNRFKAAISAFGIFSLMSDFLNSESPRWESEYLGGTYWERPELYRERSPVSLAQQIETPILVMHGDSDGNTFFSNSQELYTALRLLGKTVEFVRYPREGHGFSEPRHRIDEMQRQRSWFRRYLTSSCGKDARIGERVLRDGWELVVTSLETISPAARADDKRRYLEVTFAIRDAAEQRRSLTISPGDLGIRKAGENARLKRPVGLPIHALGQTILARGSGWKFELQPGKDEPGLSAALSVVFIAPMAGGEFVFLLTDFPPIRFELAPEEGDDPTEVDA